MRFVVRAWRRTDVADDRIWDFRFTLPDDGKEYRLPTEDGATLLISKPGTGFLKVDYLNPEYFASQTALTINKPVEIRDERSRIVRFIFGWRASATDTGHGRYEGYRLNVEPAEKGQKGTAETFAFSADNGRVQLAVTY